jgi:hypothetical protein
VIDIDPLVDVHYGSETKRGHMTSRMKLRTERREPDHPEVLSSAW